MNKGAHGIAAFVCSLSIMAVTAQVARGGVLTVDDDGGAGIAFTQIADAVAAAVDGDVILVRPGTYSAFTVNDTSLVIHADTGFGTTVTVSGTIRIENLAANKSLVLRGIDVPGAATTSHEALILVNDAGYVRIEDCAFTGAPGWGNPGPFLHLDGYDAAVVTNSASVAFLRCTLDGGTYAFVFTSSPTGYGGTALAATNSGLVAYDCILRGADGGGNQQSAGGTGNVGGDGGRIEGGTILASGSQFEGGDGGSGYYGGQGGSGFVLAGGGLARVLGTTFQAGSAGSGLFPGSPGLPTDVVNSDIVELDGVPRHHDIVSPVREGQLVQQHFHGLPGEPVFLIFSLAPGDQWLGGLQGTFLVGSPSQVLFIGNADASGSANLAFTIVPELGTGLQDVTVHCQGIFAGTGGGAVLGGLSVLLLLDGAL